jgi:DNA polymerase V
MTVFIQTNRFIPGEFYSNAATFGVEPTQDTFALIENALRGARSIFRQGKRYWKAGVMLNDLQDAKTATAQMFPTRDPIKSAKLMGVMDGLDLARKIKRYLKAYSANAKPIQWKYSDPTRRIRSNELSATGH